jgi:hypothetical protein
MKVVINKCFGGFGISAEALKELVIRDAKCIEKMTTKKYYGGESKNNKDWEKRWEKDFAEYTDLGDGFLCHKHEYDIFKDDIIYSLKDSYKNETRTDKDLIEVVESMGEESFGNFADLAVIEIPDNISWEIDDYDGMENIEECHRSWG